VAEYITISFKVPKRWREAKKSLLETWKHLVKLGLIESKRKQDRELYLSLKEKN